MAHNHVSEHGALFHRKGERFVPTPLARGPWDPNALHGGAPSALFAHALGAHDPGPAMFVARLTVELMRPVPLAPLQLVARTIRPGRNVQWVEGVLLANGDEVAHATMLRMREAPVDVQGAVSKPAPVMAPRGDGEELVSFGTDDVGMWAAFEKVLFDGGWERTGPAAAWFRLVCPVLDDAPPTPFERVAACADFGSGVGNPLPFTTASAINAEITIHTHRHPVGEWVGLDSGGWAQPTGVGLVETRLHDDAGTIGRASQALLVTPLAEPRRS
ncbi:MAG: thioesterase family protein [Actinomycetota bacterium]